MKTTIDKKSSVRHRISVEVSPQRVERSATAVLGEMQKETAIKGFRKGEVPLDILKKYLGQDINKEVIKKVIRNTYVEALRRENSVPISEPFIEHENYTEGDPFIYHASFDVMPEIVTPEYDGVKLEKEKLEVTKEELEEGIKRLQYSMTQLEPAPDGQVGPDMIALIDFDGTADGKSFKGSEAKDFVAEYGNMLQLFEKGIKGMKQGEERDITFEYPKDYFNKEIAGKQGKFHVKVKELRKKIIPELNDDLAKSLGKYEKFDQVKKEIENQIFKLKENYQKQQLSLQIVRKLATDNPIEVPEIMVSDELGAMLEDLAQQLKANGQSFEDAGINTKDFVNKNYNEAIMRVRGYLLVFSISKKEDIKINDKDIEDRMAIIAQQTRQDVKKVQEHFNKNNLIEKLKSQMLYEKTLDLILSKAKIKEVKAKSKAEETPKKTSEKKEKPAKAKK